MKPLLIAPFQQQLLRQRAALLQQLEQQRGGDSRVDSASAHLNRGEESHAQAFSERELELILDDRETTELEAVEAALKRIEEGVYGDCIQCGTEIPLARLQVAPEAPRCIACQGQYEQTHKSTSGP